ncbi:universal stress protein [Allosphingosinicella humi]|jgi:nucleotide-binding universal stress UspA family protein
MQSILLHIYDDSGLESRLQAALDLARVFSGHITCLHATPLEDYLAVDPLVAAELPEEFSDKMRDLRLALQKRIEERLAGEGVSWNWVHVDDLISTALIRASALNDIIVLSIASPAPLRDELRPLAAKVSTRAPAPVLAVPAASVRLKFERPAVVAWNGSSEAAAALKAAVPLLRLVPEVHLLEVEEKIAGFPRDLAARYLARHGIESEIVQHAPIDGDIAETIRRAASTFDAAFIVMGAYGHSRLREWLLGGVTRALIQDSAVPLLLAH